MAVAAELELGATEDPRALVVGDPQALAATRQRLGTMADAFGWTATGLARIDVGSWQGEAADAFRAAYPGAPARWSAAHRAFSSAAAGWDAYQRVVGWAQDRAALAVRRYQAGVAASRDAVARRVDDVARYNAQVEAASRGEAPAPTPLPPFVDPGPAQIAAARDVLTSARQQRDRIADGVAATLREAAALAPDPPSGVGALVADVVDEARGDLGEVGTVLSGAAEGVEGAVRELRTLNPTDPWNARHPAAYLDGMSAAAAGVVTAAAHPLRAVAGLVGTGWGSDPERAAGRLASEVLLSAAGGGAVKATRTALREATPAVAPRAPVATRPEAVPARGPVPTDPDPAAPPFSPLPERPAPAHGGDRPASGGPGGAGAGAAGRPDGAAAAGEPPPADGSGAAAAGGPSVSGGAGSPPGQPSEAATGDGRGVGPAASGGPAPGGQGVAQGAAGPGAGGQVGVGQVGVGQEASGQGAGGQVGVGQGSGAAAAGGEGSAAAATGGSGSPVFAATRSAVGAPARPDVPDLAGPGPDGLARGVVGAPGPAAPASDAAGRGAAPVRSGRGAVPATAGRDPAPVPGGSDPSLGPSDALVAADARAARELAAAGQGLPRGEARLGASAAQANPAPAPAPTTPVFRPPPTTGGRASGPAGTAGRHRVAGGGEPRGSEATPAVPVRDARGRPVIPAGFRDAAQFTAFGAAVRRGLAAAGFPDVRVIFTGSSVTGIKFTTAVPFDVGRLSDYDLALGDPTLFAAAEKAGVPVRRNPTRTRPLDDVDMTRLGLKALQRDLSRSAGRKVSFMLYPSAEAALGRRPGIEVTP